MSSTATNAPAAISPATVPKTSGAPLDEGSALMSVEGDESVTVGATVVVAVALGEVVPPSSGGTSAVSALTMFRSPKPHSSSRPGGPMSSAVDVNR